MLTCLPQSLCTWNFRIPDASAGPGALTFNFFTEQGAITLGGADFTIRKHGPLSGHWTLEQTSQTCQNRRQPRIGTFPGQRTAPGPLPPQIQPRQPLQHSRFIHKLPISHNHRGPSLSIPVVHKRRKTIDLQPPRPPANNLLRRAAYLILRRQFPHQPRAYLRIAKMVIPEHPPRPLQHRAQPRPPSPRPRTPQILTQIRVMQKRAPARLQHPRQLRDIPIHHPAIRVHQRVKTEYKIDRPFRRRLERFPVSHMVLNVIASRESLPAMLNTSRRNIDRDQPVAQLPQVIRPSPIPASYLEDRPRRHTPRDPWQDRPMPLHLHTPPRRRPFIPPPDSLPQPLPLINPNILRHFHDAAVIHPISGRFLHFASNFLGPAAPIPSLFQLAISHYQLAIPFFVCLPPHPYLELFRFNLTHALARREPLRGLSSLACINQYRRCA